MNAGDFAFLRDLLRRDAAMVLEPEKQYFAETRLIGLAAHDGYDSVEALMGRVRASPDPALRRRVVEAMTIHETSFFRDLHSFDALRTEILPRLLAARAADRQLGIWCCACSSGQEPYSVAMLLADHFPQLRGWKVRLVATDLSAQILAAARHAEYTQLEVNRGLPAALLTRHFTRTPTGTWKIAEPIRRMVEFQEANLAGAWPSLGRVDVVFLRNVMIYFDTPTKRTILEKMNRLLPRDGALFLGSTESTYGVDDSLERVSIGKALCYRPGAAAGTARSEPSFSR